MITIGRIRTMTGYDLEGITFRKVEKFMALNVYSIKVIGLA
jgi:hypothetical protein